MKKFNKLIKIELGLLLVFTIFSLFASFYKVKSSSVEADEVNSDVTLTLSAKIENGYVVPSSWSSLMFTFKLNKAPETDVILTFHAEDMTAICEAGDYHYYTSDDYELTNKEKVDLTHGTTSITINSSNYNNVVIQYYINNTTYGAIGPDGEYLFNYFNFVIDSVENATFTQDTTYKCRLGVTALLNMSKYDSGSNLDGYYYYSYFTKQCDNSFSFDVAKSGSTRVYLTCCDDFGDDLAQVYQNTVSKGWGQLNMCMWMSHMDSTVYNIKTVDFYVLFGNNSNVLCYDGIGKINDGGENYDDNDHEKMDIDEGKPSGISYYTETEPWKDGDTHTKTYFVVPEEWGYEYYVNITNNTSVCARWGEGKTKERLSDEDDPVLKETYVNTDKLMSEGKLRLILRFSELVDGHETSINGYLGGNKPLIFRYVTGAGTNTLVYEADLRTSEFMKSSLVYTKLVIDSFDGLVYDLGYNWSKKDTNSIKIKYEVQEVAVNIDLRKPELSEASTDHQADYSKVRTVSVTVDSVSKGKLYYCWTKDLTGEYDSIDTYNNIITNGDAERYADVKTIDVSADESITFSITSPLGLSGDYYLQVLVVSEFGKQINDVFGVKESGSLVSGYHFDNTIPTLSVSASDESTQYSKIYDFSVNDNYEAGNNYSPAGIDYINLMIYEGTSPENVTNITLWSETSNIRLYKTGSIASGVWSGQFEITLDTEASKIKLEGKELATISDLGYGTYYYYFYVSDKAGNTTYTDTFVYSSEKYDTRTQFDCRWSSNKDNLYLEVDGKYATGMEENVFDINEIGGEALSFTFTNEEADNSTIKKDEISLLKVYYGNKNNVVYDSTVTDSSYAEYITLEDVIDSSNSKKTNLIIKPLKAGFYKFEFVLNRTLFDEDSDDTNNPVSQLFTNNEFEFYVTDRSWDSTKGVYNYEKTTNYLNSKKDLSIINKVFQLGNSYIYMSSAEKVVLEEYNNCASPASFSSETKALEYLKYMEYQDLQLCVLGTQEASLLKGGGSTKYQKADGQDNVEPKAGQTWIRYKRLTWNENSSLEGWAYYYYSPRSEDTINISLLNSNCPLLINAMNTIVDNYLKKGSWVYLTEEDYFDTNNCPTLKDEQIHDQLETIGKTKTGSSYSSLLSYEADNGMYLNSTTIGGDTYVIASNLVLSLNDVRKLYYLDEVSNTLIKINALDGETLGNAIGDAYGSGKLRFVELDENGTSEFYLVVDKEAPVVNLSWVITGDSEKEEIASTDMNQKNDGDIYSAKTMTISCSKYTSELDPLAYVAVYTSPQYQFVSITYYKDLSSNPIELEDGNYYVVIGDRYGNAYKFTAQVCSTPFESTVEVVDGEYVLVTTNRTSDQIERFEVRCNNILDDEEYNEKGNKYYEDGYYNIFIKDIYGYTNSTSGEFGNSCLFERSLPNLTWYYTNSNNGYSKYDETSTSCMKITSSPETNTFYINTARTLRFVYDGEYEYEFTGISTSDITKSDTGHYVNINTSDNWTMKIWYTQYPNVVATYVCTNDTQSPTISCTYKANSYELYEQDEMDLFASTKAINEYYYLDSVKFRKVGTKTQNISENDCVTASLITVKANDLSGMNSVVIYLNDEIYKEYYDIDGDFSGCSLSRSGTYRIVAMDNFGNQKEFKFTNSPQSLVETEIDSIVIDEIDSSVLFGNTSSSFTLKDNAVIYIKVENYFLLYTLRDGKLIYTRFINTDIGGGEKSLEYDTKTKVITNEDDEKETVDDAFFDINSNEFKSETIYEFMANNETVQLSQNFKELEGIKFYISYTLDGNITIKFVCPSDETLEMDVSILLEDVTEPYSFSSKLSKEITDIKIETKDGNLISCEDDKVVRTNTNFNIVSFENNSNLADIIEISYSYSKVKEFIEYKVILENNKFTNLLDTSENGFYSLLITNKYGNTINYIINRSNEYSILGYAIYDDYVESRFDSEYGEELIKANNEIRFEAYTDLDDRNSFELLKNGEVVKITGLTYDDGYYSFTIHDEGVYKLTAIDSYGNTVVKNFEINKSNISYSDSYIDGFDSDALWLDKGYTSKVLNIDIENIGKDDIKYISTITESEGTSKGYKTVTKVERILYNDLTQDSVGLYSKYSWVITYLYTYYIDSETATLTSKTKQLIDLTTGEVLEETTENKELAKTNADFTNKFIGIIGNEGENDYEVIFRDSYGSVAKKDIHYKESSTLTITRHTRSGTKDEVIDINDAEINGVWSNSSIVFDSTSKNFTCTSIYNGEKTQVTKFPLTFAFTAENGQGKFEYSLEYVDEYGFNHTIEIHLVRQELSMDLSEDIVIETIDNVDTTRNNIKLTFTNGANCVYRLDSGEEIVYNQNDVLYKDGTYRFEVSDQAGNVVTKVIRKDTTCEFEFKVGTTGKVLISGDVVNSGTVKFESSENDSVSIKAAYRNNELQDSSIGSFSKDGLWTILVEDKIGNIQLFEFTIITHEMSYFEYTTPFTYKISEFWYDSGDGVLIDVMDLITHTDSNSSFEIKDDGIYTVVMISTIMKDTIDFTFTIDTSIPNTALVGCEEGERTNNDITFENISKGDVVQIYRNGELYSKVEITENGDIPTITEGGEYKVIITNEAGVSTTLNFIRNDIANSAGSALIIAILVLCVFGIIIGSVIHNRQKVDD